MKRIVKILSFFISFMLISDCFSSFTLKSSAESEDFIIYTVSENTATITGCKNTVVGSLTIPETLGGYPVTEIGPFAFDTCSKLLEINIPKSVSSISVYSFYNCRNITEVNVDADSMFYSSENGVLFDKEKTTLVAYPAGKTGIYEIPTGVKRIGENAFFSSKLEGTVIPDGVETIGTCAFLDCYGISRITVPSSVTNIGNGAFAYAGLKNADLMCSLAVLEDNIFANCSQLKNIYLPKELSTVKNNAFDNCKSLKNVYFAGGNDKWSLINVYDGNDCLNSAEVHYYSKGIPHEALSFKIYSKPDKLAFLEKIDPLVVAGGKLKVSYSDETFEIIDMSESTVLGYDNTRVGVQSLTVYYCGQTDEFDIEIIASVSSHKYENGVCGICGAKKTSLRNIDAIEPPFVHNGEYIYGIYSFTDDNASEMLLDMSEVSGRYNYNTHIYVYGYNYEEIGSYTSNELKTKVIKVEGNTVRFRIVSDSGDLKYDVDIISLYEFEKGDIDGDFAVGATDLGLLKKGLLGMKILNEYQQKNADINKDGIINILDLVSLKKKLAV